jgi:hypothetical protein
MAPPREESGNLLQKSTRGSYRIGIRNNRIGTNGFLTLRCLSVLDLDSILRAWMSKILLQQNRPDSDFHNVRFSAACEGIADG